VRAPNLSELFAATITQNQQVFNRLLPASAPAITVNNQTIGNPNLKPETAQTTEIGIIFQPSWIPGFNFSVDYYRVGVKKGVGKLANGQALVDLCQIGGNANACTLFFLNGAPGTSTPNYTTLQPFNGASLVNDGFDIEASYQFELEDYGVPGAFTARALATHTSKYISNTGIPGDAVTEFAGSAASQGGVQTGVPLWKAIFSQGWSSDPVSLNVTERFFSNGVINPYGVECQAPNCPVPTVQHPTYDNMHVPGYLFVDFGGTYKVSSGVTAYFQVNNAADSLPKPGTLTPNADPVGRVYHLGVRFNN
jgi:outer membrane receptor protein involved in Fe transport